MSAPLSRAQAAGDPHYITFHAEPGALALAADGKNAPICVADDDWPGVRRAAKDLSEDFGRVTGTPAAVSCQTAKDGSAILAGTLGRSSLIDSLVRSHKIDVEAIRGKWEATLTVTVDHPQSGVRRALLVIGSDKRGTIFGLYDLSRAIGVSPWYWWADVPAAHHRDIYALAGKWISPEPAVKYRGIFLNDEAPALSGWVHATYGTYNHNFYERVFELLLRMHANYLWPAMWDNAFNEDDPLNPKLADEYGIVMGTSHHEPMIRAQQEWKRHGKGDWNYATNSDVLRDFWTKGIERNANLESTITIGMRGDGDMPMSENDDIALLEKIVADQRAIIKDHETPTLKSDPQVWALYKEVQGYYEKGMRVPDDVTLLWCDDNWGNIRRLPTAEERKRSGGAGIYYHFDYVGGPRSYKWLLTYPLPKVWEQMNLALHYDARRIWIVNVGDLKPMEMPIEFFLDMGRSGTAITQDSIPQWTREWAARQFGEEHAAAIADLLAKYTKYNGRRKPEQLEPETWSLLQDGEADRVEAEWTTLAAQAKEIGQQLPQEVRPAYFELVLYPIEASANLNQLYIATGRNHLWANQGRSAANAAADEARKFFAQDAHLTDEYNHELLNGRWNHMMDQTHIGYTFWNEPPLNSMPAVHYVQPQKSARMGVALDGSAFPLSAESGWRGQLQFDSLNQQTRTATVFNMGEGSLRWTAQADAPWVKLSSTSGTADLQASIQISIDWANAPSGNADSAVHVVEDGGRKVNFAVHARKPEDISRAALQGFAEASGTLSIDAEHTTGRSEGSGLHWATLPDYGETLSAVTIFPVDAATASDPAHSAALEYRVWFDDQGAFDGDFVLGPTLDFLPARGLHFAVGIDGDKPKIVDALPDSSLQAWEKSVSDGVHHVKVPLEISARGYHTVKVYAVDPGVVLEKIVLRRTQSPSRNRSAVSAPSYLGPVESFHAADRVIGSK